MAPILFRESYPLATSLSWNVYRSCCAFIPFSGERKKIFFSFYFERRGRAYGNRKYPATGTFSLFSCLMCVPTIAEKAA